MNSPQRRKVRRETKRNTNKQDTLVNKNKCSLDKMKMIWVFSLCPLRFPLRSLRLCGEFIFIHSKLHFAKVLYCKCFIFCEYSAQILFPLDFDI